MGDPDDELPQALDLPVPGRHRLEVSAIAVVLSLGVAFLLWLVCGQAHEARIVFEEMNIELPGLTVLTLDIADSQALAVLLTLILTAGIGIVIANLFGSVGMRLLLLAVFMLFAGLPVGVMRLSLELPMRHLSQALEVSPPPEQGR